MIKIFYRGERFNPNFFWHLGFDVDYSLLIVEDGRRMLLTSEMTYNQAKEFAERSRKKLEIVKGLNLRKLAKSLSGKVVGMDFSQESASLLKLLEKNGVKVVDIHKEMCEKRTRKRHFEVMRLRKAYTLTKSFFDTLKAEVRPGLSELEVEKMIRMFALENGIDVSFSPIVAADRNSSLPHHRSSESIIQDLVLIDFGFAWKKYASDFTDVIIFSKNNKYINVYEKIKNILWEAVDVANERGIETAKDIVEVFEGIFKERGLPLPPHRLGHGIGIEVHECPHLPSDAILEGSVLALEPARYLRSFGIRYERMFIVKGKKLKEL